MAPKLTEFDTADYLDSPEMRAGYLKEALATGDAAIIARALGAVARAEGISKIASETGRSRAALHRSFKESGNPTLKTLLSVLHSVGLELSAVPAKNKPRAKTSAGVS